MDLLFFLALQAVTAAQVQEAQQALDAATNSATACFQQTAERWWELRDDARSIADAALYVCDSQLQSEAITFQNALLATAMSKGASTQGWEQAVAQHKQEFRERMRVAAVAVVLDKRSKRERGESK